MSNKELKNNRLEEIKNQKKLANKFLTENKVLKANSKGWKLRVVENNIRMLKNIIVELNKALDEKSVNTYVNSELQFEDSLNNGFDKKSFDWNFLAKKMGEGFINYKILKYSPLFSITHDLYWIEEGTIEDKIAVAVGNKSPEFYEKFLDEKIDFIESKVLPFLQNDKKYKTVVSVFIVSIKESKKGSYLTSNILLITAIESLVRLLGKFVYMNQNPNLSFEEIDDYISNGFSSLESLISKGNWSKDLFIDYFEAKILNEYIDDESINQIQLIDKNNLLLKKWYEEKISEVIKEIKSNSEDENFHLRIKSKLDDIGVVLEEKKIDINDKNIGISFKTKLQFLLRSYKADRNQLIHGNFKEFDKKWKNYIYFSALKKVYELLLLYNEKYENS